MLGQPSIPGMGTQSSGTENKITWQGVDGESNSVQLSGPMASDTVDSENTPTTTLRGGLVVSSTPTGTLTLYSASDNTEATSADTASSVPCGILADTIDMTDRLGDAFSRTGQYYGAGLIRRDACYNLDKQAEAVLTRQGVLFDDNHPNGAAFLVHPLAVIEKVANYTVTAADNGKLFVANKTSAVTFTLPTIAVGLSYEFLNIGTGGMVIDGASNIVHAGAITTDSITATVIGSRFRLLAAYTGTTPALKWLVEKLDDTTAERSQRWTMPAFGTWAEDGDEIVTSAGGGIVGDVATASILYNYIYDATEDEFGIVSSATDMTGVTGSDYQMLPDSPVENSAFYLGNEAQFCEVSFNLDTLATYGADSFAIEYWDGTAWSDLTVAVNSTGSTVRPWTAAGALSFVPPDDWAETDVDSDAAYWIRFRCIATVNVTQVPVLDSVVVPRVVPSDGFTAPATGTITSVRLTDGAATLHTTNDVTFILVNFTTGAHSGELTFPQDQRSDTFDIGTIADTNEITVTAGDILGILVTGEDGTNEVTNAIVELNVTLT